MFEREYRELSDVPRWTIIRTIKKQNVAEHSYYVTLYAGQIAKFIEWKGDRALLLDCAIFHDLEESFTSDIPGPSKRAIIDKDKLHGFICIGLSERFGFAGIREIMKEEEKEVWAILKTANLCDECFFLCIDQQLGNRAIMNVFEHSLLRLRESISNLPANAGIQQLLYEELSKAVYAHRNEQSIIPTG